MKLPYRLIFSAVAGLSFLAHATTLLALDVPGLATRSDAVVRGRVVSTRARITGDGARIMTDAEIDVLEVLKGPAAAHVTVMQPGGVVGDVGQVVHGVAAFVPGEEVVVFLEARGARATVTGMLQGRFVVDRQAAAPIARQQADGDADYLDLATHQPTTHAPIVLGLDALRAQVQATLAPVTTPVVPAGPVKVTP